VLLAGYLNCLCHVVELFFYLVYNVLKIVKCLEVSINVRRYINGLIISRQKHETFFDRLHVTKGIV
jgi:hypothetical protein